MKLAFRILARRGHHLHLVRHRHKPANIPATFSPVPVDMMLPVLADEGQEQHANQPVKNQHLDAADEEFKLPVRAVVQQASECLGVYH